MTKSPASQPLDKEAQQRLIEEIQRHAEVFCDSKGKTLRTLRVGPGRRDRITLRDGEFSSETDLAMQILNQSFAALQKPKRTAATFSYTSLRSGKRISVSVADINALRTAVSYETNQPDALESATALELVATETLGGKIIARLTREGWDMMRLYLFGA